MGSKLKVISFNCKGFKSRNYSYLNRLYKNCDILFMQETWLHNFEKKDINNVLPGASYFCVSGMKDDDIGRQGRPHGGVGIVWHSTLKARVHRVNTTSERLCAATFTTKGLKFLAVNVYMPNDDGSMNNFNLYGDILDEISSLLILYQDYECIIGGDMNVDIERNSLNTNLLKYFIESENMKCSNSEYNLPGKYTFENSLGNRSKIDCFLYESCSVVANYDILVDGDNLSDHNPIMIILCTKSEINNSIDSSEEYDKEKLCWNKADNNDISQYKNMLNVLLQEVVIPGDVKNCKSFNCKIHGNEILNYMDSIINCLILASQVAIPKSKIKFNNKEGRCMPGWNEHVRPYREQSILIGKQWSDAGCPINCPLDRDRKFAKRQYHSAIRFVKSNKDRIIKNKISANLKNKHFSQFWKQIRLIKNVNKVNPSVIDNEIGNKNVTKLFFNKYHDLYNMYNDSFKDDIDEYFKDNWKKCQSNNCNYTHKFSGDDIVRSLKNLKSDKVDYIYGVSSNHFINSTPLLIDRLTILFNLILTHGITHKKLNSSIIVPVRKSNSLSPNDSGNYRAISINTILCKIFEYLISFLLDEKISSNKYQFGYKKNVSTTMCSFMVTSTIQYYTSGGSPIYCAFLDLSKAFDKVRHSKLFRLLMNHGVCAVLLRLIAVMYLNNSSCIRWKDATSEYFSLTNGVKQGGVLSPYLFSLYLEPLIDKLTMSGVGCRMGNIMCNVFVYADDVVLLAPSVRALQDLTRICDQYSDNFDLSFNGDKSEILIFENGKNINSNINICLNNKRLKISSNYCHLGIIFRKINGNVNIDINPAIKDIKVKANILNNEFRFLNFEPRVKLFNSHCLSLYGCPLWDLNNSEINKLEVAWRKSCRYMLGVSPRTRSKLLPGLMGTESVINIIHNRMINFYMVGLNHDNHIINTVFRNVLVGNFSYFKNNINAILGLNRFNYNVLFQNVKIKFKYNSQEDIEWRIVLIKEILKMKEDYDTEFILSRTELQNILDAVCTA